METKTVTLQTAQAHKVGLIKGDFSPEEAREILESLINQKIKFNEVRKFQRWTNDHNADSSDLDNRIAELKTERNDLLKFMEALIGSGKTISINGEVNIKVKEADTL